MSNVHLIAHPLVQHKLTLMRRKNASTSSMSAATVLPGLGDAGDRIF